MKQLGLIPVLFVAACAQGPNFAGSMPGSLGGAGGMTATNANSAALDPDPVKTPPTETLDETPPPPPRPSARTVDEFDTTTAEDRAAALAAPAAASSQVLGKTVGSLGAPGDPGIWIKTPLVKTLTPGRAKVLSSGKSVNVELRPSGGLPGSGSQISLAAMRLMEVPLTDLPELELSRLPG